MAKERAQAPEEQTDTLAWMATFSDLLTLLLTFFVLLISMSSMDNRALKQTFGFFKDAMGVLDKVATSEVHRESPLPIQAIIANKIVRKLGMFSGMKAKPHLVAQEIDRYIDQSNLEDVLETRAVPGGLMLSVAAGVLFEKGTARLLPEAAEVLDAVADILSEPHLNAEIQGRQLETDGAGDPWELAGERALAVNRYLMTRGAVDPTKLSVSAYGPGWSDEALPGRPEKLNIVLTWSGQLQ
ncbi:MAG: hypothetical protein D6806_16140 [Deltaproteobacteria bacterium]|nr:MAG: hypothetical protein D6806_16140 [Deltaproteobacteria bacterium]